MSYRREIREVVLQALYAEEVGKDDWAHILSNIIKEKLKERREDYKFAERLFLKTLRNQNVLDEIIQNHIRNWRIERLNIIDKIVLRMALCEFLYFEEIPIKVTINEAIEIARKFSTSKSSKFVNGILDAALGRLLKENKIEKKGRGLIESSINN